MTCKVTAVVSTYNSEQFIRGRLQNLVDQSLYKKGELEIIVIDSHSPENEKEVVEEFQAKYNHIIYKRTSGRETLYKAWNRGIELMNGDYFINANTDDRFTPDALEKLAASLDNDWNADAAYGNWLYTGVQNDHIHSSTDKVLVTYPNYFPPAFIYFQITGHACLIRKNIFDEIGLFDPSYTIYGDREFMLRFALKGKKALHTGQTIGLYFENREGLVNQVNDKNQKEFKKISKDFFKKGNLLKLFSFTEQDSYPTHLELLDYVLALCKNELYAGEKSYFFYKLGEDIVNSIHRSHQDSYKSARLENNSGIISLAAGKKDQARRYFEKALMLTLSEYETTSGKTGWTQIIADNRQKCRKGVSDAENYHWISIDKNRFKSSYSIEKRRQLEEIRDTKKLNHTYQKLAGNLQKCIQTGHLDKAYRMIDKYRNSGIARSDLNILHLLLLQQSNKAKAEEIIRDIQWGDMNHPEMVPLVVDKIEKSGWNDLTITFLNDCFAHTFDRDEQLINKWYDYHFDEGNFSYLIDQLSKLESEATDKKKLTCLLQKALKARWVKEFGSIKEYQTKEVTNPLISVIISTYNAEKFIAARLDNLLMQTISNQIEIIIINSGSQQRESDIVASYKKRFKNIKLIETGRETVYKAWNRGIKAARGTYVTNGNTDDRHRLDALEKLADIFRQQQELDILYPNVLQTRNENLSFKEEFVHSAFNFAEYHPEILRAGYCFPGPMPMWKKSLHDEAGYFEEDFVSSGDLEFWNRVVSEIEHCKMKNINKYLGLYLKSPQSIEHRNEQAKSEEHTIIKKRYDIW